MNKIFRFIALFEAILTLFIVFSLGNKIDKQDIVIDNQKNIIDTISKENIRLRIEEHQLRKYGDLISKGV